MKKTSYLVLLLGIVFLATALVMAQDADTTAPAAVTDLTVATTAETSATLNWTAPGDDSLTGTSTSYILRYATSTITVSNWDLATDVDNEPTPQVASSTEAMTVAGLESSTTYYFALKSKDEADNESDLSNVASGTTSTPAPVCGNGQIESGEQCDDGNTEDGDGCSAVCQEEEEEPSADLEAEMRVTPRTLNLSSQGRWISVHLFIPLPYKANDVDISSIKLNGTLSPDGNFRGINHFSQGNQDKERKHSSLLLKFSRSELIALVGDATGDFEVTVTGNIDDQTFSASDTIKVLSSISIDDEEEDIDEDEDEEEEDCEEAEGDEEECDDEDEDEEEDEEECEEEDDEDCEEVEEATLVQAEGESEVYVIKNHKRRHIPSIQAFNRHGYQWEKIKKVSKYVIDAYLDDELLKSSDSPAVYIIIAGMKRHIPTAEVFEAYGFDWDDISIVPTADLDDYENVRLIRKAGDDRVYLLAGGKRHWVPTLAVFNANGYKWENVIIVNEVEEEAIETGGIVE